MDYDFREMLLYEPHPYLFDKILEHIKEKSEKGSDMRTLYVDYANRHMESWPDSQRVCGALSKLIASSMLQTLARKLYISRWSTHLGEECRNIKEIVSSSLGSVGHRPLLLESIRNQVTFWHHNHQLNESILFENYESWNSVRSLRLRNTRIRGSEHSTLSSMFPSLRSLWVEGHLLFDDGFTGEIEKSIDDLIIHLDTAPENWAPKSRILRVFRGGVTAEVMGIINYAVCEHLVLAKPRDLRVLSLERPGLRHIHFCAFSGFSQRRRVNETSYEYIHSVFEYALQFLPDLESVSIMRKLHPEIGNDGVQRLSDIFGVKFQLINELSFDEG